MFRIRYQTKEYDEEILKIREEIKALKNKTPDTKYITTAFESLLKNNMYLTEPQEPVKPTGRKNNGSPGPSNSSPSSSSSTPERRSSRKSPGKEIGFYRNMGFGNAVFPELEELLSDPNWHLCFSENQLILKLDYILIEKNKELKEQLNELNKIFPGKSLAILKSNYRKFANSERDFLYKVENERNKLELQKMSNIQNQNNLDFLAKKIVKAKYVTLPKERAKPKPNQGNYNPTAPNYTPFGKKVKRKVKKGVNPEKGVNPKKVSLTKLKKDILFLSK